jgi:mannosyl-3-phosphoglycerate phosphatase
MNTPSHDAKPLLIFTDLDGTLLDFETYSPAGALPVLAKIKAAGLPVIFCSSKTAAEQRPLREQLGLTAFPYIVENGAAIVVPAASKLACGDWPVSAGEVKEKRWVLGLPASAVRAGIHKAALKARISLTGFADLGPEKVAGLTGLDAAAARRAITREYSETLVDDYAESLWAKLDPYFAEEGLQCRHGGRFHTVSGIESDKGRAVTAVVELYRETSPYSIITIGLGDSANDAAMLTVVDHAYLIGHTANQASNWSIPGLEAIPVSGSRGWAAALQRWV